MQLQNVWTSNVSEVRRGKPKGLFFHILILKISVHTAHRRSMMHIVQTCISAPIFSHKVSVRCHAVRTLWCLLCFTTCWENQYDYADSKFPTYAKVTVCSLRNIHYLQGKETGPWQVQVSIKVQLWYKGWESLKEMSMNFLDCTPSQETYVLPGNSYSQLRI